MIDPEVAHRLRCLIGHPDEPWLDPTDEELDEMTKDTAIRASIELNVALTRMAQDIAAAMPTTLKQAVAKLCQRSA